MRFIKHNTFINNYIKNVRKYITSLIDFIIVVDDFIRFRINGIS